MSNTPKRRRYVVSDLGFTYAVHDTQVEQEYAFESGKDSEHPSSNPLNSERVALYATRDEAEREALRLNEQNERRAS